MFFKNLLHKRVSWLVLVGLIAVVLPLSSMAATLAQDFVVNPGNTFSVVCATPASLVNVKRQSGRVTGACTQGFTPTTTPTATSTIVPIVTSTVAPPTVVPATIVPATVVPVATDTPTATTTPLPTSTPVPPTSVPPTSVPSSGSCGLAQTAFCETFDAPAGTGNRSGDLNGTLWGVSRATSNDNPSQNLVYNWAAVVENQCGTNVTVLPPHDVAICQGQLVEGTDDNGAVTVLAAYPKQPFDIAGRSGTATFDVGNDTQGPHAAWPAFVYTDQPVPAPYSHAAGVNDTPRNSFGVSFANLCGQYGCGQNVPSGVGDPSFRCVSADSMWITTNYQLTVLPMQVVGCVLPATQYGVLSHIQIRLSANSAEVWATDPGQTTFREIAVASNFTMPLSRGLIWIEDVHYNANKDDTQRSHSFVWDNVGFDGPRLPRDLTFDVSDSTAAGSTSLDGLPTQNLGYYIPASGSLNLQVSGITNIAQAQGAALLLTYWAHSTLTLSYSVNEHAWHTAAWAFDPGATYVSQTIALPVPLNEIVSGTNSLQIATDDSSGTSIANIDVLLIGAGG